MHPADPRQMSFPQSSRDRAISHFRGQAFGAQSVGEPQPVLRPRRFPHSLPQGGRTPMDKALPLGLATAVTGTGAVVSATHSKLSAALGRLNPSDSGFGRARLCQSGAASSLETGPGPGLAFQGSSSLSRRLAGATPSSVQHAQILLCEGRAGGDVGGAAGAVVAASSTG